MNMRREAFQDLGRFTKDACVTGSHQLFLYYACAEGEKGMSAGDTGGHQVGDTVRLRTREGLERLCKIRTAHRTMNSFAPNELQSACIVNC